MMLHRHRTLVVLAVPPVHGFTFAPLALKVAMLIIPMLPRPAFAILIANLFVPLMPLKPLVVSMTIVILCRCTHRCPQSHCQN